MQQALFPTVTTGVLAIGQQYRFRMSMPVYASFSAVVLKGKELAGEHLLLTSQITGLMFEVWAQGG